MCVCDRACSASVLCTMRMTQTFLLKLARLLLAMGGYLARPSQRMIAERNDPRITIAPPVVDVYPDGPFGLPSGWILIPRESDQIRADWPSYGVARTRVTGHSAYRLHFCAGHCSLADLERYASDLRNHRLTTVNAPQVWAIYCDKYASPRDVYTVAKRLRTKLMSYARFCDLLDLIVMTLNLHAAGRPSPSTMARWAQVRVSD